MIDSTSVTSVVFFGDGLRGSFCPLHLRGPSFKAGMNGLTTAMNVRLQRELELLEEARGVYLPSATTITFRARGKRSVSLRRGKRSEKKNL